MRHPRSVGRPAAVLVAMLTFVVLGAGAAGCSGAPPSAAPATTAPVAPGTTAAWVAGSGGRQVLDGFREVTVHIRQPDGSVRDQCLLLAADEAQRERGLMFVTDPALGGHPGMLFRFERDDDGAFWMKNTILPLSIAYVAADGSLVSTADMAPCPSDAATCPTYPPAGPYRDAVEVPQGRLAAAGLVEGATLTVGEVGCA